MHIIRNCVLRNRFSRHTAFTRRLSLFAVGTFCKFRPEAINIWVATVVLTIAAIAGDAANYHLGKLLGPKVLAGKLHWLNQKHLERTHRFFEKYGGKTIIIARFVPIVRTFAPFVAGVGTMSYRKFLAYNIVGGTAWVVACLQAGYWLGNIPLIRDHFELAVIVIVVVSLLPAVWEFALVRFFRKEEALPPSVAEKSSIRWPPDTARHPVRPCSRCRRR